MLFQFQAQIDLFLDVIRGLRIDLRRKAMKSSPIGPPFRGISGRNLFSGLASSAGRQLHLVFALVRIRNQVSDVRDIDDVRDFEPLKNQESLEKIRRELRSHVPDMRGTVDGGTAGIDPHATGFERLEDLLATRQGVVEDNIAQRRILSS